MDEKPDGMSWDKALNSDRANDDRDTTMVEGAPAAVGVGLSPPATGDDPEQIRAQIEQTRAGMSETIDAIQERLSPERLKEQAQEQVEVLADHAKERVGEIADQAKEKLQETIHESVQTVGDAVYDATIGKARKVMHNVGDATQHMGASIRDAGSSIISTVRRNPLPAALIGLGLGMLLMDRRKRRIYDYDDDSDGSADWSYEASRVREQERSGGGAERARNAVGDFVGSAQEAVGNVASQARDQVSDLGNEVQQVARRAQSQYEVSLQENPLAVGAVAMAMGAAVGLALPSTRVENEWMGDARENLTQAAEKAARSTIEKVQQVAGEAGRAARQEAEHQGLTETTQQ